MGKIRTKIIGLEEVEEKQKREAQVRREQKRKRVKEDVAQSGVEPAKPAVEAKDSKKEPKPLTKARVIVKRSRGANYQKAAKLINRAKTYSLSDAVALLKKMGFARFDETVEVHLNVKAAGMKKDVSFPHGTGRERQVAVLDENLFQQISQGKLEFDVLIAAPSFMPRLVKYAKILGPKGLMPNPKNGTLTEKTAEAADKFKKGAVQIKTEAKFPLVHTAVGKLSFDEDKLCANIRVLIKAFSPTAITSAFVKTTMSPAIRLDLTSA